MGHPCPPNQVMRYGPGSAWARHDDRGGPRAIQNSQESLRALAKRYGINQKTVAKWRERTSVADLPISALVRGGGRHRPFRRYTLLPLDDCLYALQLTIPHLTRSSLHRCLQRHGSGRLPDVEGDKPAKKKFKAYPIGFFHVDIAEVRTEQGKLHMFVAIDRTAGSPVELHEKAPTAISKEFLLRLIATVPYRIHTVLSQPFRGGGPPKDGGVEVRSMHRQWRQTGAVVTRHEMLDDVSLYWLTESGASAAQIYWEDHSNNFNAVTL